MVSCINLFAGEIIPILFLKGQVGKMSYTPVKSTLLVRNVTRFILVIFY